MMIITRGMPAVQAMAHIEQEITDWRPPHLCQSFTLCVTHSSAWGPAQHRLVDNRCGTEAIAVASSTCEKGCVIRAMLCRYHVRDLEAAFKDKALKCPRCTSGSTFGELTYAQLATHQGPRYSADYEDTTYKAWEAAGTWRDRRDAASRMDEAIYRGADWRVPDMDDVRRPDGMPESEFATQETIDEFVTNFFNGKWNGGYGRRGGG